MKLKFALRLLVCLFGGSILFVFYFRKPARLSYHGASGLPNSINLKYPISETGYSHVGRAGGRKSVASVTADNGYASIKPSSPCPRVKEIGRQGPWGQMSIYNKVGAP